MVKQSVGKTAKVSKIVDSKRQQGDVGRVEAGDGFVKAFVVCCFVVCSESPVGEVRQIEQARCRNNSVTGGGKGDICGKKVVRGFGVRRGCEGQTNVGRAAVRRGGGHEARGFENDIMF